RPGRPSKPSRHLRRDRPSGRPARRSLGCGRRLRARPAAGAVGRCPTAVRQRELARGDHPNRHRGAAHLLLPQGLAAGRPARGALPRPRQGVWRLPAREGAQGAARVAVGPSGVGGGLTRLGGGNVLIGPALWMGGGGVVGAVIGALVAVEVPGPILARVWGAFLVASAYRLGIQAIRPSSPTR